MTDDTRTRPTVKPRHRLARSAAAALVLLVSMTAAVAASTTPARADGVTARADGVTARADGVTARADGVTARADGVSVPGVQQAGTCYTETDAFASALESWIWGDTIASVNNLGTYTVARDSPSVTNTMIAPLYLGLSVAAPGPMVDVAEASGFNFVVTSDPSHASSFTWGTDGSFSWNPAPGWYGGDSFQWSVQIPASGVCIAGSTVTIPPPAVDHLADDTYTAFNNQTLNSVPVCGDQGVAPSPVAGQKGDKTCGVLTNDMASYIQGYGLGPGSPVYVPGYRPTFPTAHGTVTLQADGAFSYTPVAGYVGSDSFYYSTGPVRSIGSTSIFGDGYARVTFNDIDPPALLPNTPYTNKVLEDTSLKISPTFDAGQPDASAIMALNGDDSGQVRTQHGTLTSTWNTGVVTTSGYTSSCPSGFQEFCQNTNVASITYTPDPGYYGPDQFSYTTANQLFSPTLAGSATPYTAYISVNESLIVPTAAASCATQTVTEHTPAPVNLGAAYSDPNQVTEPASSTVASTTDPLLGQGTLVLTSAGWTFTGTSAGQETATFNLPYAYTGSIAAGQSDATGAIAPCVTFDITYRGANDYAFSTNENQPLTVPVGTGLESDNDPVDSGTAALVTPPQDGQVTVDGDGSFTYTPNNDFHGVDTFTYTDLGSTGTVTVTVDHVLQAPTVVLNTTCPAGQSCPSADNRGQLTVGQTGQLTGYVLDPEFSGGTLTVDWGDGTVESHQYPCQPGAGCPFTATPTYSVCVTQICPLGLPPAGALYFTLSHVYSSVPSAVTTTYPVGVQASAVDGLSGGATSSSTVSPLTQTISFTSTAPSGIVGGPDYTPAATSTSGLPVTLSLDSSSTGCELDAGTVTFTGVGTCVIDANQPGDGSTTAAAPQTQQSIPVAYSQTITSAPSATFSRGVPGSFDVTATGTPAPTLSIAGKLDGLAFDPGSGTISGTPTRVGTFPVTVTASNGAGSPSVQTLTLTVLGLHVTTLDLPSAGRGVPYATTLEAPGGVGALTWKATSSLPSGLKLSSSGVVTGTPGSSLTEGTITFTVRVTDSHAPKADVSTATISIDIGSDLFVTDGTRVDEVAPDGTTRLIASGFSQLAGIGVDGSGNLYVSDAGTETVVKVTQKGSKKVLLTGLGQAAGVAVDPSGDIYVANAGAGTVVERSAAGVKHVVARGLIDPTAVAVFDGNIFVTETSIGVVSEITPGGPPVVVDTAGELYSPDGLAVSPLGNLYISDAVTGYLWTTDAAAPGLLFEQFGYVPDAAGMTVDGGGNVVVASPATGSLFNQFGPLAGGFNSPTDVAAW